MASEEGSSTEDESALVQTTTVQILDQFDSTGNVVCYSGICASVTYFALAGGFVWYSKQNCAADVADVDAASAFKYLSAACCAVGLIGLLVAAVSKDVVQNMAMDVIKEKHRKEGRDVGTSSEDFDDSAGCRSKAKPVAILLLVAQALKGALWLFAAFKLFRSTGCQSMPIAVSLLIAEALTSLLALSSSGGALSSIFPSMAAKMHHMT
eukprot:TRINITY_DN8349_c0_g2_i1.p1 TRINITY_DN8349_c0_g2~~TRINITY_DN8349_c0_g2_i1.p1  ORF type:complete len:209 (+),score=39.24 TRINITY_DN8349_c0_g2_i1:73-699(+)